MSGMRNDGCVRAYWDVMDQCEGTQIFGSRIFFLKEGFQVSIAQLLAAMNITCC